MTPLTVCSYSSNGPYHSPSIETTVVGTLSGLLYSVKSAMEDGVEYIAVFDNGECKGLWMDDAEPEPDGEGDWYFPSPSYVLHRPGDISAGMWNMYTARFK